MKTKREEYEQRNGKGYVSSCPSAVSSGGESTKGICFEWLEKGTCSRGANCTFAHDADKKGVGKGKGKGGGKGGKGKKGDGKTNGKPKAKAKAKARANSQGSNGSQKSNGSDKK